MTWATWGAEPFARAKEQGKPVLAAVGPLPPEALKAVESEIASRFVAVLADPEARPDAAARIGAGRAVVLDATGARRADLALPASGGELARLADAASKPAGPEGPSAPAWTGATTDKKPGAAPGEAEAAAVFAALGAVPSPAVVEALLHAAGERGDGAARANLTKALEAKLAPRDPASRAPLPGEGLGGHARWAALFWDAHALTGEARWKDAAAACSDWLLRSLYDGVAGAFRRAPGTDAGVYPAEGNALAAIALLRAAAFGHPGAAGAADKSLAFLRTGLYDPLLGLQHSRGGGEDVCGLLGDAAWTALAFTDAFLATGVKAHREFADAMLRFLFQELWEREAGGFLDRVPRADDPAILREPRVDPELNAVALETCRRLHHLKGNHNYRRWTEWGVLGAWKAAPDAPSSRAGLARVADLHARGRMDLELVGRPGEPKAEALLAAVHRLYLPRKVISFVDPDDQDYILAHKLEAETYPRLFACGSDLRRLADAAEPADVPAVAEAARKAA